MRSDRRRLGEILFTEVVWRKSEKVGKSETDLLAVKVWKKCGVEKKNFLKILWKAGIFFFNTVETV
jgi:hypothetical protein